MATTKEKKKQTLDDPWAHRSEGMRCMTCMWYVKKMAKETETDDQSWAVIEIGRCRKHAPTMNGYPVVYMSDFCGDHKLDENKL